MRPALRHFDDRQLRALKEAVRNVFWKKSEIRRVFQRSGAPNSLVSAIDWENNRTWDSVDQTLEALNSSTNGEAVIRRLAKETLQYPDGKHLAWAGAERVEAAEKSLGLLRQILGEKREEKHRAEATARAREVAIDEATRHKLRGTKLQELYSEYTHWFGVSDVHERGLR